MLTPSRTPASTSNWRTQLRTADSVKSRSRATSPIERGPSLTSLTVSSLNSFENLRLVRLMVVTSKAIIARSQQPGWCHTGATFTGIEEPRLVAKQQRDRLRPTGGGPLY